MILGVAKNRISLIDKRWNDAGIRREARRKNQRRLRTFELGQGAAPVPRASHSARSPVDSPHYPNLRAARLPRASISRSSDANPK